LYKSPKFTQSDPNNIISPRLNPAYSKSIHQGAWAGTAESDHE